MAAIDEAVRSAIIDWGAMSLTLDEAVEQVRSAIAAALDGKQILQPGYYAAGYNEGVKDVRRALLGTEGETT